MMRVLRAVALLIAGLSAVAPWIATPVPWIVRHEGGWSFPIFGVGDAADVSLFIIAGAAAAWALRSRLRLTILLVVGTCMFARAIGTTMDPPPVAAEIVVRAPIPYDGITRDLTATRIPVGTSIRHPLGTDATGRDVAARFLRGVRNSLAVATLVTLVATATGIVIGLLLAVGPPVLRLSTDLFATTVVAVPAILVLLAVRSVVGGGIVPFVVVLATLRIPAVARVTHAAARDLLAAPFVRASFGLGLPAVHVYLRTIVPHASAAACALAGFGIVGAILAESALGFLGLGWSTTMPSLGALLEETRDLPSSPGLVALLLGVVLVGLGSSALEVSRRAANAGETRT